MSAAAEGSYAFRGDVAQTAVPDASVTSAGRVSRTDTLHLEGIADLDLGAFEVSMWSDSAASHRAPPDAGVRVVGGQTFERRGAGAWAPTDDGASIVAPTGDVLAYLAGATDVHRLESVVVTGRTVERYGSSIDGPAYAEAIADDMADAMRAAGDIGPNVALDPSPYLAGVTGEGVLWVDDLGLPVRQSISLLFPPQGGDAIDARVDVDFFEFGADFDFGLAGGGRTTLPLIGTASNALLLSLAVTLALVAGALVLLGASRRVRLKVVAVGVSGALLVSGPFAGTADAADASLPDSEASSSVDVTALARDALAGRPTAVDPHTPVAGLGAARYAVSGAAAPAAAGDDTDGDTLSDEIEGRIGTDPASVDTDDDGLDDRTESSASPWPAADPPGTPTRSPSTATATAWPFRNLGVRNVQVDLGTTWTTHRIEFTATATSDDARLRFWLSPYDEPGAVIDIDEVHLTRAG